MLALVSALASVHEYSAVFGSEMATAYDCDGPGTVLMLSIPAALFAVTGIVVSVRRARIAPRLAARIAIAVGLIVLFAMAARLPLLIEQARRNAAPDSPCR